MCYYQIVANLSNVYKLVHTTEPTVSINSREIKQRDLLIVWDSRRIFPR